MLSFTEIWQRIIDHAGQTFHQIRGNSFTYTVRDNAVLPNRTHQNLSWWQFAKAWERSPLQGPGQLQDLRGPSYLYAILTDPRISGTATV